MEGGPLGLEGKEEGGDLFWAVGPDKGPGESGKWG